MCTIIDVIKQLELLKDTFLAKRSLINFEECIYFLKDNKIVSVIILLKNLRGTDWEIRLYSYKLMILDSGLFFLDLNSMIRILEKCENSTVFSRIYKKFWEPLRRGGSYKI